MEDTSLSDSSDNNYTVTKVNNVTRSSGYFGYGAYFDGIADYLNVENSSDWDIGTQAFTIDFWMNTSTNGSENARIMDFSLDSNFTIVTDNDGFGNETGFRSSGWIIKAWHSANNWQHIAFARDSGGTFRSYTD